MFGKKEALGTAGALALVDGFIHDHVLMMNSDLLTNIDFEDLFLFLKNKSRFSSCLHSLIKLMCLMQLWKLMVKGYGALKKNQPIRIIPMQGIYLMKKEVIDNVPQNEVFNATDLMEKLIQG